MADKCTCGEPKNARCVDCGCDIHAPALGDCDNQHHEFEPEATR